MSEALKSAWSFMKMDIEEFSISNNVKIDTIGAGTEFTVYVPFLEEDICIEFSLQSYWASDNTRRYESGCRNLPRQKYNFS